MKAHDIMLNICESILLIWMCYRFVVVTWEWIVALGGRDDRGDGRAGIGHWASQGVVDIQEPSRLCCGGSRKVQWKGQSMVEPSLQTLHEGEYLTIRLQMIIELEG